MKRLAAICLTICFLLVQGLFGAQAAQPQPRQEPSRLRFDVEQMNPRVLTSNSTTLNISGKVTNIGDRKLSKLQVRLQFGERITTERQFTESVEGTTPTDASVSPFTDVTDVLEPGASAPLNITVPLTAFKPTKTGVFPLLVNINGVPEFGGQARLAALNMLLPVLGIPGKQAPEKQAKAAQVSILWPLTSTVPHVATWPFHNQLTLDNDQLADDLDQGGRLNSLVKAAQTIQDDSKLFNSLCFAVDPDLISIVDEMSRGYLVRTGGSPVTGRGTELAKQWLGNLRQVVNGHCMVPLPFADADLSVLSAVKNGEQADSELVTKAAAQTAVLENILKAVPVENTLWPDGPLDSATIGALTSAGVKTVITESTRVQSTEQLDAPVTLAGSDLHVQPADSLTSAALSVGDKPNNAAAKPAVSTQNGLAAIAFRAGLGQGQTNPGRLVVAPPRRWSAPLPELITMLRTLSSFTESGMVSPVALKDSLTSNPSATAESNHTSQDLATAPSADFTGTLTDIDTSITNLTSAMTVDSTAQVKPIELVTPIRDGLIRATSGAWRTAGGGIPASTGNARGELTYLTSQVGVVNPTQRFSLTSGSSPLPVTLSNDLPVAMMVQVGLNNSTGLRSPDEIAPRSIPANAKRQQLVPIEALRAGRFSVDVSLSTPAGTRLGSTAKFELSSNEYGTLTLIVTIVAGAALLLLSSRRIYRRIKESKATRV
ncbi:DUF6049 family protein [Amycolatopsis sp. cg5]|uniref:DUF6049 family protein n=1 Tax=Amycolatopsis sp. cg5 TaxID=3238802 RepID=UPI00352331FC